MKIDRKYIFDKLINTKPVRFALKLPKIFLDPKWALNKLKAKMKTQMTYDKWIEAHKLPQDELERERSEKFAKSPLFSIIVWGRYGHAMDTIDSIIAQTYERYEVIMLETKYEYKPLEKGRFIMIETDVCEKGELIKKAKGEYIIFIRTGDVIEPNALYETAKLINEEKAVDAIYTDSDRINDKGERHSPLFKPDMSIEYLRSFYYVGDMLIVKKAAGDNIKWFDKGCGDADFYGLMLKMTECSTNIFHIPEVLYHRRNENDKDIKAEEAKPVLEAHLKRMKVDALVDIKGNNICQVMYNIKKNHKISIIIPNKNNPEYLAACIDSINNKSTYRDYEIIIIDNNSTDIKTFDLYEKYKADSKIRLFQYNHPYNFSKINNYGAKLAQGDVFLLLNSDTEVISPDWLERMLEFVQKDEIGVAGAKLYYKDMTIQHAGVAVGEDGYVLLLHRFEKLESDGYMKRLKAIQNVLVNMGACQMVRRDVYEKLGGYDESYIVHYSDSDFCLKVYKAGYRNVWTPYSELYHYESKIRGYDNTPEKLKILSDDKAIFIKKWNEYIGSLRNKDPFYNKNLNITEKSFTLG